MVKTKTFNEPGHFIGAANCKFFRHTHVGRYCVSTVGDWRPHGEASGPFEIGASWGNARALYETMVFDIYGRTRRWTELECRRYETAEEARDGHRRAVARWVRKARAKAREAKP